MPVSTFISDVILFICIHTCASFCVSEIVQRSNRVWLMLFSKTRAVCTASTPVPHSSWSGFYNIKSGIKFQYKWKCNLNQWKKLIQTIQM